MNLETLQLKVDRRMDAAIKSFDVWNSQISSSRTHESIQFGEGLLSYVWQHWGVFCRSLLLHSSVGCQTAGGATLSGVISPTSSERFSWLSVQVKRQKKDFSKSGVNTVLRHEPTWGDVSSCMSVIKAISPHNKNTLLSAFGGMTGGAFHLQKVRNAAAHLNSDTHSEILALATHYNAKNIRHPVEVMLWEDPVVNDFAFVSWVEELRNVAELAVK